MTTKLKPISFFIPFDGPLIERAVSARELVGSDLVPGYAFVNEVVRGEGGIRLTRGAMERATPRWLMFGNIREMHGKIAAGVCPAQNAWWDEVGLFIAPEIVDPVAKEKCDRGVYKGYSVSVLPTLMAPDRLTVQECDIIETSLVDRPKDPGALFSVYRADGVDPDAEYEVEVAPGDGGSEGARERGSETADDLEEAAEMPENYSIAETAGQFRVNGPDGQLLGEYPSRAEAVARAREVAEAMRGEEPVGVVPQPEPQPLAYPDGTGEARAAEAPVLAEGEEVTMRHDKERGMWQLFRASDDQLLTEAVDLPGLGEWIRANVTRTETSETVPSRENLEGQAAGTTACPDCDAATGRCSRCDRAMSECHCMAAERGDGGSEGARERVSETADPAPPVAPSPPPSLAPSLPPATLIDGAIVTRLHSLELENAGLLARSLQAESELSRVLLAKEGVDRLLAGAEEQIKRLESMPAPQAPLIYAKAWTPEHFSTLRSEQGDRKVEILSRLAQIAQLPVAENDTEQHARAREIGGLKAELRNLE